MPPPEPGPSGSTHALVVALILPAGLFAQLRSPLAGLLWTELFVFLLPALLLAVGSNLAPRAWLRLERAPPAAVGLGALAGLAGWFLGSALFSAVRAVAPASLVQRFDLSRLFEGSIVEQVAFAVTAVVVAPVCEELIFRGHLASAYHSRHRPAFAIGASAVLFALLHLDPIRAASLLVLGAIYGWLTWRSGSIWPAVVAHATNNGVAATLAFTASEELAEEPTLRMALVGVAAGLVALASVVALFRKVVPQTTAPPGLPRLDPTDPAAGFRLRRVPMVLRLVALAGWASLGGLLVGP